MAISTNRAPAWNWTIRGCTIVGAGTGMYLGNSDGRNPFVAGVIERNVVRDTLGYNLQIKHQAPWPDLPGLPAGRTVTIIRDNVFSKAANGSTGAQARPNVLIGDVPPSGRGSANGYEIYRNHFSQNPTEALFQGEGNVTLYANVFVNDAGAAVTVQPHNGRVRDILVLGNTVVAAGHGISIRGGRCGIRAARRRQRRVRGACPSSAARRRRTSPAVTRRRCAISSLRSRPRPSATSIRGPAC